MTGATNLLVLEGLETQDIALAIERHASRYGVPGELFIYYKPQLKALEYARFNIRDIDSQVMTPWGSECMFQMLRAMRSAAK